MLDISHYAGLGDYQNSGQHASGRLGFIEQSIFYSGRRLEAEVQATN